MTPEAADYLSRAREDLEEARQVAAIGLARVAARAAYMAAFHAAEALIFEKMGRIAKTHAGTRTEFARLARTVPGLSGEMTRFLAQGYRWKEIGDYLVGEEARVTPEEATGALASATEFVARVTAVLEADEPPSGQ